MAEKPETKFKKRILPLLRALPNSWWVKVQQVGIRGTPDLIGCVRGYFIALELKASEDDEAMPLQEYNLKQIFEAGGFGAVVTPENFDEIYDLLQKLSIGAVEIKIIREEGKETLQ